MALTTAVIIPPRQKKRPPSKALPAISIIIPFRNEQHSLWELLLSLSRQTYRGTWEVILVNDRSTDDFLPVIERFRRSYPHISVRLQDSNFTDTIGLTGKQQALEAGVKTARYDWLAFTDADVQVAAHWLESLSSRIRTGAEFVYGHTAIIAQTGDLFAQFQKFQLRLLFCTALAFSRAQLTGSCMGNNLCISKHLYQKIGGQAGIGYSIVEDRELMKHARLRGKSAVPTLPFLPTVFTYPEKTAASFYAQAGRWVLGGLTGSRLLLVVMLMLALQNITFVGTLTGLHGPLRILPKINAALLWGFCLVSFARTGKIIQALFFPVFYISMIIESMILSIGILISRRICWKGEVLKTT
ncbi:MAG: glycosyltransferase [Fibrobacterota bacterium]